MGVGMSVVLRLMVASLIVFQGMSWGGHWAARMAHAEPLTPLTP
jgi:dienelactone hydrolase